MHAIIAGTNKAGTTSLFRYLSDHPGVCPSRIKELEFFKRELAGTSEELLAAYDACFPGCAETAVVRLESTPAYLSGGAQVAARIRRIVPEAKLVFLLREPVSRLLSFFFQNRQTRFNAGVAGLSLADFVSLVEAVAEKGEPVGDHGPAGNAYVQFQKGCYAPYLAEYLEYFPTQNILPLFFDELASDANRCVSRTASFLGLDTEFFGGYSFRPENKTRQYKHAALHTIGSRANRLLEPYLNRYPAVRQAIRKAYLSINEKAGSRPAIPESVGRRLNLLYQEHNSTLAILLRETFPDLELPAWVGAQRIPSPTTDRAAAPNG